MVERRRNPDPLRLEVFHHLFAAVSEEMGAALMRSAFSPNIRERRDFSCALFDAQGRTVSQAAHIPVHLGSLPLSVAAALEEVEMGPGDAVVLNDPFRGGTHLPDITLVSPIFLPGRRSADFYCANRAHHADVGGAHPGSMAPAADVHAEGLRIPPLRLVRAGRADRAVLELLVANMRVPREREGDLLAQVSANRLGARRLAELAREHGAPELRRRAGELMDWTERLCRALLAQLPRGRFEFSDRLEVAPGRSARLHAVVRLRSGVLEVDLRGCDDQVEGGSSAPRAVALSAVLYVLRLFLPAGTPANDGVLRCVRVLTRPESLVDARYPAAVAAGNVETSQRLVDVLLGALARAAPDRVPAASSGTMSNLTLGSARSGGAAFSYYETIAGGAGASPQGPGAHSVHTHMTNTRNTPIEELENALPVRVLACSVRRGSGGAGLHAGGDGVTKRLRFLEPSHVAWIADRSERGPWGLAGGGAGAGGSARLSRARSARSLALPSKVAFEVAAGDELELCTPGGGGWGRARRPARAHPSPRSKPMRSGR
jgi:N-methylhydantoinase B